MTFTAGQRLTAAALAGLPQKIGNVTLSTSAANMSINVPTGYSAIQGFWNGRNDTASTNLNVSMQINGDTGSNYPYMSTTATGSTVSASGTAATTAIYMGNIPAASATANYFGGGSFSIANPNSSVFKVVTGQSYDAFANATASMFTVAWGGIYLSTSPISSVQIVVAGGTNFVAGSSFTLYGMP